MTSIRRETSRPTDRRAREDHRFMVTPALRARLQDKVADVVRSAVAGLLDFAPAGAADRAAAAVPAFFDLYGRRPVRDNKGGSLFNDSLWLFAAARAFQPDLVVESGVFRGHSTWLLRQACPDADIHSFDVNLENLVHRDPQATLHHCDWIEAALPRVAPGRSLAYFDDHISQARRLVEAYERGFRHLLFDDNFPVYNLYATGGPPVPTLAMVMDDELEAGGEIRWSRNGKEYACRVDEDDLRRARALIARYHILPDIAPITRYNPGSGLTVVKLID